MRMSNLGYNGNMELMMKHPTNVPKYPGSLEELARDVCKMRYDAVANFFGYCADYLINRLSIHSLGYPLSS